MHPWPPIGENLARLRSLAGRADLSADLIRRLEQGSRQTALIGSLYEIANGLDVPLSVLLSQQPVFSGQEVAEVPESGRIDGLRRLLQPVNDGTEVAPEPWALPDLQRSTRDAWRSYQSGELARLGRAASRLHRQRAAALS